MSRSIETIATDVLLEVAMTTQASGEPVLGDVTAQELVALVAGQILTCPSCGAEAWVNLDCDMCQTVSSVVEARSR